MLGGQGHSLVIDLERSGWREEEAKRGWEKVNGAG